LARSRATHSLAEPRPPMALVPTVARPEPSRAMISVPRRSTIASQRPAAPTNQANAGALETEAILSGLFTQVDLLRCEVEGVRGELASLMVVARGSQIRRRRLRSDLPAELRRQISPTRRERRLAHV